jgi:hypothetical protein
MTDQELIQKLNTLKQVRPESSWKKKTREILLSQTANTVAKEIKFNPLEKVFYDLKNAFSFLPKTAWAVTCLVIILVGGSYSVYAAKNSKPGDSFYALRVWKGEIQLAMTFNQEEKAKLDMKLASIHAKEISEVLADPSFSAHKGNEKKAEELAKNFKEQINIVKTRLSEINDIQDKNMVAKNHEPAKEAVAEKQPETNTGDNSDDVKVGIGKITKENDGKVYSVESGKDNKGMQIYDSNSLKASNSLSDLKVPAAIPTTSKLSNGNISSSGAEIIPPAVSVSTSSVGVSDKIKNNLDLATESFAVKDFTGAKNIMEQVGVIIEKIDNGKVKGENEINTSATSTENNNDPAGVSSSSGNK